MGELVEPRGGLRDEGELGKRGIYILRDEEESGEVRLVIGKKNFLAQISGFLE